MDCQLQRLSVLLGLLSILLLHCASSSDSSQEVIGLVDRTLLLRWVNLLLRDPSASAADLYVNNGGLYLLERNVTMRGMVNSICGFGYSNTNFDHFLFIPNTTAFDITTDVRLFVFVVLLRLLPKDMSQYSLVYPPAILHHDLNEDCLGQSDGLEWFTEPGDKIGVFIPDSCVELRSLEGVFVSEELRNSQFNKLCPSQMNLVLDIPRYGTYVSNSSLLGIDNFLKDEITFDMEGFENVSVWLNMNVSITAVPATENNGLVTLLVSAMVVGCGVFLAMGAAFVVISFVVLWRRKRRSRKHLQKVTVEGGAIVVPDTSTNISNSAIPTSEQIHQVINSSSARYANCSLDQPNSTTNSNNDGYESNNFHFLPNRSSYSIIVQHVEYDYDEVYFEPASQVDELLQQLSALSVPIISDEELKLSKVIGSGEFGTVYRGVWFPSESLSEGELPEQQQKDKHSHLGQAVAVKCMDDSSTEKEQVKFLQEAAMMAQFNHPNIINLLGIVIQDQLKIVVNLMKGDLRQHLISLHPNSLDEELPELGPTLLSFSRQIAFGMVYLSCKSFVHRDLAARNILVSSDGTLCKIADFGLSRDLQKQNYYVSQGGKIPVKWTAPEALAYRRYSPASDAWSYGCVLYEIWSLGHKPFEDYSNKEAIKLVESGYRLPPPPGCPRPIYETMMGCWDPDETKRLTFLNIVVALQKPDFQLLKLSLQESDSLSRVLGASLEVSKNLYADLQNMYTKKSRISLSSSHRTNKIKLQESS